jgi:DNA phosphorothioation-dependent restriction protein DptH
MESDETERGAPDQRYWWMQLHRLIASRTVIDKMQQMEVLTALERLAEGDFTISWDASVFAFWIDAHEDGVQHIGSWNPPSQDNLTAKIFCMGNSFIMQTADDDRYTPTPWEELEKSVSPASDNVCDILDDSIILADEDDDVDVATWEDEDSEDEETNLSDQSKYEEEQLNEQADSEAFDDPNVLVLKNEILEEKSSIEKTKVSAEQATTSKKEQIESVVETASPGHLRILLGETIPGGKPIYWEFGHQGLENRHLLIFGKSGVGKTYAIQCLLNEMGRLRQNSLIVDYTDGFLPNHLEEVTNAVLRPKQYIIRQKPLPINPFIPQTSDAGGIPIEENANAVAKRIASIFESVYNIGDQQYSVLHEVIMEGVELYGLNMSLDKMLKLIEDRIEDKRQKANAQTLFSKIRPFILDNPFDEGKDDLKWQTLFNDQENFCHIFQLVGLDKLTRVIVTEFVLWNLYAYLQAYGNKNDPKVIVLDEVQNLDLRDGSPLSKYLVEGRKFGVSLILATQIMSNMKKEERDRMFNAAQRLFFRPADTEIKSFAAIAAWTTRLSTDEWVQRLASLGKGECYSMGPSWHESSNKLFFNAHRIKISSLEDRGFNV